MDDLPPRSRRRLHVLLSVTFVVAALIAWTRVFGDGLIYRVFVEVFSWRPWWSIHAPEFWIVSIPVSLVIGFAVAMCARERRDLIFFTVSVAVVSIWALCLWLSSQFEF